MFKFWLNAFLFPVMMMADGDGGGGDGSDGSGDGQGDLGDGDGGDSSGDGGGDSGASGDGGTGGEPNWPETWREIYAGDDEKKLARLGRYATPTAALDALFAAQNKISSGELVSSEPFPNEGTDEQKAAWREQHGIPAAADKYELSLPEGTVIGEDDEPLIQNFLEAAFEANMPAEQASRAVNWYFEAQEIQAAAREDADAEIKQTTEDKLRAEYGDQYRGNINMVHGLLDTAPEGVKDKILGSRLEDGTPLASDAGVLSYLVQLAHEINPVTTLVPGAGANMTESIADEISNLEAKMADRNSDYWKGPNAQKNQERYRNLVAARDKVAAKEKVA